MDNIVSISVRNNIGLTALVLFLASCGGGSPDESVKEIEAIPMRSALVMPAGDPTDGVTSATIGAAGGSLRTPDDEIVLAIPPGALSSDTTIGIEPLSNTAPGGLGGGYRLTPDGQTFERPIQVTIPYGDLDLMGIPTDALGIATQTAEGYWQWLDGAVVDNDNQTVTVSVRHFSDYSLVEGFQIRPYFRQAHTGEQVPIKIAYCYATTDDELAPLVPPEPDDELAPLVPPEPDDELAPLVPPEPTKESAAEPRYRCNLGDDPHWYPPVRMVPKVLAWKVNGAKGGNTTVGTISGDSANGSATYTAPLSSPDPNIVTVSADLPWGKKGMMVATALIEIDEPGRIYEGNLRYSAVSPGQSVTLSGDVTWIEGDSGSDSFLASGKLNLKISAECSRQDDKGRLQKGEMKFAGDVRFQGEMNFGVPTAERYSFLLGTNSDDAPLVCNGITVPYAMLLVSLMCDETWISSRLGDGRSLTASTVCADDGTQLEWSFARTK